MKRLERYTGTEWERVHGRGGYPAPTQVQAEDTADVTGKLYSWPVLRLKQFVTAWWATISENFLSRVNGTATNLQGTRQATITNAGITSINWAAGHVIIDGVSLNLTGGFTNIPTTNAAALQVIVKHTGSLQTLALPVAQLEKSFTLAGTSGGLDLLHLLPTGSGKYAVIVVESV